jgi:hypothetical protein
LEIARKRSAVRVGPFRVQPSGCHRCVDTGTLKREEERTLNGRAEARTPNRHAKAIRREKKREEERTLNGRAEV